MNIKISELDGKTLVLEVEEGDTGPIVEMLNTQENGYAIMGPKVEVPMAVVDTRILKEDWVSSDHLLAIEAHELGHIRMNSPEEPIAETEGIRLLKASGYLRASQLLEDRGIV